MTAALRVIGAVKLALLAWWLWKGLPTWVIVGYATACGLIAGAAGVAADRWLTHRPTFAVAGVRMLQALTVAAILIGVAVTMAWQPTAGAVAVGWFTHWAGPRAWTWSRRQWQAAAARLRYRRVVTPNAAEMAELLAEIRRRRAAGAAR